MTRIDKLWITSDFDTLKNDGVATATVVVPGGAIVAAGASNVYETTVAVGAPESILIVSVNNNIMYPNGEYASLSNAVRFDREGIVGGVGGFAYSIIVRSAHTGGNNVRLVCSIKNNYSSPLTLASATESFTFRIQSVQVPRFS